MYVPVSGVAAPAPVALGQFSSEAPRLLYLAGEGRVPEPSVYFGERVERCSDRLWRKLRTLDPEAVEERLAPTLGKPRIRALLARRERIVARLEGLIAERGERWVIFRYGEAAYGIERE